MNRSDRCRVRSRHFDFSRIFGFLRNENAVAAVEFALVMPLLLLLYFGTLEVSRMISEDRRLTQVAATLGDLVAQTKDDLPKSTLDDFFTAAEITLAPYDSSTLIQRVSSVYIEDDGSTTVKWSYADNGGVAHTVGSAYVIPDEFKALASARYVIVSEATVSYKLLTRFIFENGIDMYQRSLFVPRFGEEITVSP